MEPKPRGPRETKTRKPGPDATHEATRPSKTQDVPLETYEQSSDRGHGTESRTNISQPTGSERTARDEP